MASDSKYKNLSFIKMIIGKISFAVLALIIFSFAFVNSAVAQEAAKITPVANKGDIVWLMLSTILVLMMAVPGLALFYGGLVRAKNMLSTLMQVSIVTAIGMLVWVFWGYSLSFSDGGGLNAFVGGFSKVFLIDVNLKTFAETYTPNVFAPEMLYMVFQMTFACITAAVVLGGLVERIKFSAICMFAIIWPLLSYYPLAHMAWFWPGATSVIGQSADQINQHSGLFWRWGLLDFAGGTVVEINCGVSALVGCLVLGSRQGYRNEPMAPHSLTLAYVGAGLLWIGWFGFNAGSALEANEYAILAMANTLLATAAAGISWAAFEWIFSSKPSMLGFASGVVAGLVGVTPAAGYIGPMGAIILGLIVSPICIIFCAKVKAALKYDDSLDAFGIHGIGGMVGTIATGILASPALGGAGAVDYFNCTINGCASMDYNILTQTWAQLKSVIVAIAWAACASAITFNIIKYTIGLRVNSDAEEDGLDIAEHGERAYHH